MLSLTDLYRAHPDAWKSLSGPDGPAPSWTGPLWSGWHKCFVHVHEWMFGDAYRCSRLDGTGSPVVARDDLFIDFTVEGVATRFATACARAMGAKVSDGVYGLYYTATPHPTFELEGTSPWGPGWCWKLYGGRWSLYCSASGPMEILPVLLDYKLGAESGAHAFLGALVLSLADRIAAGSTR